MRATLVCYLGGFAAAILAVGGSGLTGDTISTVTVIGFVTLIVQWFEPLIDWREFEARRERRKSQKPRTF